MLKPIRSLWAVAALAATTLGACGSTPATAATATRSRPRIVGAFYPLEEVLRNVLGTQANVSGLTPPGVSAHDYEPSPKQFAALEDADVVFYLGSGFQPALEKAMESLPSSVRVVDLLDSLVLLPITAQLTGTEGEVAGEVLADGNDPHVWLDPANMVRMAQAAVLELEDMPGIDRVDLIADALAYESGLLTLDQRFAVALTKCGSTTLVTSHRAFGYLAQRYGLQQVSIAGISPSDEPSAKTLSAVADFAKQHHVTTVFFEQNLSAALADTVASEIGAESAVLNPVEGLSQEELDNGGSYTTVMEQNLAALTKGLRCI